MFKVYVCMYAYIFSDNTSLIVFPPKLFCCWLSRTPELEATSHQCLESLPPQKHSSSSFPPWCLFSIMLTLWHSLPPLHIHPAFSPTPHSSHLILAQWFLFSKHPELVWFLYVPVVPRTSALLHIFCIFHTASKWQNLNPNPCESEVSCSLYCPILAPKFCFLLHK